MVGVGIAGLALVEAEEGGGASGKNGRAAEDMALDDDEDVEVWGSDCTMLVKTHSAG